MISYVRRSWNNYTTKFRRMCIARYTGVPMPRYRYDRIRVLASKPRDFDPRDPTALAQAVEHLRAIPDAKYVGLNVQVLVNAGRFNLDAPGFLKLDQIISRTPAQVWEALDAQIDRQIAYFERRDGRFNPN